MSTYRISVGLTPDEFASVRLQTKVIESGPPGAGLPGPTGPIGPPGSVDSAGAVQLAVIDPSGARNAIRQTTGTFESGLYSDTTMNIGYNVSTTPGVKAVASEPMFFLQWESKFRNNSGTPYGSEFHLNFMGTNPSLTNMVRPINVFMEHATHLIEVAFVADLFNVTKSDGTSLMFYGSGAWYFNKPIIVDGGASAASRIDIGVAGQASDLNLNCAAGQSNSISFIRNNVPHWLIYDQAGNELYFRDTVNGRSQMYFIAGASSASSYTDIDSILRVFGPQFDVGPGTNKLSLGSLGTADVWVDAASSSNANVAVNIRSKGTGNIISQTAHQFLGNVGFYTTAPVAKPTGVAVTAADIHAALVTLGLIAA